MRPIRPGEIERLIARAEAVKTRAFGGVEQLSRIPAPVEFGETILSSPLDPWQREYMLAAPDQARIGIAASRQAGKSAVTALFVAWCLLFVPGFQCLVASRSLRQAAHFLSKVRDAVLAVIPRDAMVQLNRLSLELPNGSAIISIPCAQPDAGRGFSPDLVILDEAAFAPEALFGAITPSLAATNGALHMLSSPNGRQGYFFDAFEGAAEEVFWTLKVIWSDCPRISPEFIAHEKIALGDIRFRQEYMSEFLSPLGAYFGSMALRAFEEGEDPPLEDLELMDMEFMADRHMPTPEPTVDDLRAALDRADRVSRLFYGD